MGHADPGERSVAAHVHARGLTTDRAADLVAAQLVRAGVLAAQEERRNAAELVGQLQRAAESGGVPPVIVVDGLDEARAQAFAVAEELLLRLAPYATVIVSTRELRRGEKDPSLMDVLTAGAAELDLDDPDAQERGRDDVRDYIAARLAGVDPLMDPDAVAAHLAGQASMTGSEPFLLARLVTDQLRASPVDTSRSGWEQQVSDSIEEAFDTDLARVRPPQTASAAPGRSPEDTARALLAALTRGLGAGLPEEEWLACSNAVTGRGFGRDDLSWVLDELGRYIIQDGEAGTAVYRIAHQSLADHIRPPFEPSYQQPFDPDARAVAGALLDRYQALLAQGLPADGPGYLWRYAWRHAAAAGLPGLELLRGLADSEPALLADVAMAAGDVSSRLSSWGYRQEAVAPTEEAARLYRELAAANPAFLPDLASALGNLGVRYSEVGRRQDALAPAEEAVGMYRELAGANPAFLPDLATSLNNLGNHYSEVGRRPEALALAEEAVQLRRELAGANPAFLPNLATSLNNLGNRYNGVGRRQDALALAEEAVGLYRELAGANPAFLPNLATSLNNLGNRYSGVGRRQDALALAEEAVGLYRELAAANPAFLPDLAMTLNNLGASYSEVGRRQDALALAEEAAGLYRELAAANLAFLPDLAGALSNLGTFYSGVGRRPDALVPAEEAAGLYRELATANPAFLPNLAGALSNLGTSYSEVGQWSAALASTEEAARLYRELAAGNPAFLPDLAGALGNLGNRYNEVGRRLDALALAEEAAGLYRELAAGNPAFLPDLAGALNNLGIRYNGMGRRPDALALAEEAVGLYRELAAANPAFLPNLAMTLNNLGNHYNGVGRRPEALAPAEEAVGLYRELAGANPAFLPDLAMTLNNLGNRYSGVGRRQDALALAEEAVGLYRELAAANPAFLPDLATSLNNLGVRYSEVGSPDRADAVWEQAVAGAEPAAGAFVLLARARAADEGAAGAAAWLAGALRLDGGNRELAAAVHQQARRHRRPDPAGFEASWIRHADGPVPAWLTVDRDLLGAAQAWTATATYKDELDYLAAHPELLDPAADTAVAEALLGEAEDEASRYAALRQAAHQDGADVAYRPLLLAILAREFAAADPAGQRVLLAECQDDLLTDIVAQILGKIAWQGGEFTVGARRAAALLDLARSGDADTLFDALADPEQFPGLMQAFAARHDPASLTAAATVALTAAAAPEEAAAALAYLAIGTAISGDQDQAAELLGQARQLDPAQVPAWINELAAVAQLHPAVLPLIPVLTAPAEPPPPPAPGDDPAGDS